MIRKLAVLTVFSVSALFFTSVIRADQAGMPNGAFPQVKPNDKLLIPRVLTKEPTDFERRMAEAGWDIRKPYNLAFHNVRHIIAKNDIVSLLNDMDKRIASEYRTACAVDSSA